MERLGLANGDRVRVTTESGRQIEVAVAAAKGDDCRRACCSSPTATSPAG